LKVFPDEVEEHLRGNDAIDDVAVAGVPDDRLGEVPWAFVVLRPGASLDADTLQQWCRDRMAPYKIPAGMTVITELPRNEMGKVLRQDLRR
jgi:acyl-CoA synthetase (AMP-forming)/AMP-acid ligase II